MSDVHEPESEVDAGAVQHRLPGTADPVGTVLEPGPHTREELHLLATCLFRSTGLRTAKPMVQHLSMALCWGGASVGGLCGLNLNMGGPTIWFLDRDVQGVLFLLSLLMGIALPLAFGVMMGRAFNRWAAGLKKMEVVLSVATIPGIGAIAAHGINQIWFNAMTRYVMPFLLLGLAVVVWVVWSISLGGPGPRLHGMNGLFFFVSSLAIYAAAPLVTGAPYWQRLVVFLTAVIPVLGPLWIQIWLSITQHWLGLNDAQQLVSIYLVLLGCHVICALTILVHLAAGASDWARRLRFMAELA
jgi:hypothetical protein